MTNKEIKALARLPHAEAKNMLDVAAGRLSMSPRSYMKTVKAARTIADIDESEDIESVHIAEALQYRNQASTP